MTGWTMFYPLVLRLISAIRDEPITLSRCSWFWNWNRFRFLLHPPLLWAPKCSSKGFCYEFSDFFKKRKQAFSFAKSNFSTLTNDFTKTKKIWWSWFLQQKLHTFVDFEQNLRKTLRKLMESISWSARNYLV